MAKIFVRVLGVTYAVRFNQLSRALYLVTIWVDSDNVVSVLVPEGKAKDVAGNSNSASNQLQVRHCSPPAISVVLYSFATASLLATSLAAALLELSSGNLAAIVGMARGDTNGFITDPSRNLLGMAGHLQVFVLSDWYSNSLPIEYSETMRGLRWLIPHEKLPWKKGTMPIFPNFPPSYVDLGNISETSKRPRNAEERASLNAVRVPYGPPLNSEEYYSYFLIPWQKGESLSATSAIKELGKYTGWQDMEMNLFWFGIGGGTLVVLHLLVLFFLQWRTRTSVHCLLSFPRFELFLLILTLPCISQSSAFMMRGGTRKEIIIGALLLAIPTAILISVLLFLTITVLTSSLFQYKEIKHQDTTHSCCSKLSNLLLGRQTVGRWFHSIETQPSLLHGFGFLFEDRKGPPILVSEPRSDQNWTNNEQGGIGRMREVNSNNVDEEDPVHKKFLGFTRTMYIVLDLLRRIGLGVISGAYSVPRQSQCIIAFGITMLQFLSLLTLKPYIRRGVQLVESVCLLCEAGLFILSFFISRSNKMKSYDAVGVAMLTLFFISFAFQLVNEWYALIKCLLRVSPSKEPSLRLGLIWAVKGLVLPVLPKRHWNQLVPGCNQPVTGLVSIVTLSPEIELGERHASHMTATVVPECSPELAGKTRPQGLTSNLKSDMNKLREMARESFSGLHEKGAECSSGYDVREMTRLDEVLPYDNSGSSSSTG